MVESRLRALVSFALAAHAMWFFGNLYEQLVFVPNAVQGSPPAHAAFNAFFDVTKPPAYYIPLTQLGVLVLSGLAIRAVPGTPGRVELRRAAVLSWCALGLTAFIVLGYNVRLWFEDVSDMAAPELHSLAWQWGGLNAVRLGIVGLATWFLWRVRLRLERIHHTLV